MNKTQARAAARAILGKRAWISERHRYRYAVGEIMSGPIEAARIVAQGDTWADTIATARAQCGRPFS